MVNFRFSTDNVPQQLFADIQTLNELSEAQLSEWIDLLLSFVAREEGIDLMGSGSAFAEKHGLSQALVKSSIRGCLYFFKCAIRGNLTPLYVKEDLLSFGVKDAHATLVSERWRKRFLALSRSVMGQTLNVNQLVDMEWKFGVTASSDDLGKLGAPFLQLKLVLDKGNHTNILKIMLQIPQSLFRSLFSLGESKTEEVVMELTLKQFYEFLREMQRARATADYLT